MKPVLLKEKKKIVVFRCDDSMWWGLTGYDE
jgi:hypothetical protein